MALSDIKPVEIFMTLTESRAAFTLYHPHAGPLASDIISDESQFINRPSCDFCSFLENLESRSKGYGSPGPANGQSPSSGSQSPIVPPSGASTGSSSPSTPQPPIPSQVLPQSPSVSASSPPPPSTAVSVAASPAVEAKPSAQSPEHLQSSAASGASAPQKRSFISRWFGSSPAAEASASAPGKILQITQAVKSSAPVHMPSPLQLG